MEPIFNLWPSIAALSRDLGLSPSTVGAWKQRGSIPGEYDVALVAAAKKRGFTLKYKTLATARAKLLE